MLSVQQMFKIIKYLHVFFALAPPKAFDFNIEAVMKFVA